MSSVSLEGRHQPHVASAISGLERFESFSLMQGAAALALWPRNADRHIALKALVDQLAEERDTMGSGKPIEARGWRRWLASRASQELRAIQAAGTHDEPLCVEAALLGRRYALLGGNLESPDLHYRLWMEALAALLVDQADAALQRALDLLESASRLSTRVVQTGDLGWYRWPDHGLPLKLGVPDDKEYRQLCEAVTIPAREVESEFGLDPAVLVALMRSGERLAPWQPLRWGPDGELLVADPWRLTLGALVRAAACAAGSPRLPILLQRLTSATLDVATEAATDMDWTVEPLDEASFVAHADVDCHLLVAVCAVAPAADGDPEMECDAPISLTERYERVAAQARELGVQHTLLAIFNDGRPFKVAPSHPYLHAAEQADPWLLGLSDLRLLGDALRRDPLALPCALERTPRPPWPEGIDLVDAVGAARRDEETPPDQSQLPADGTEHLRLRTRFMALRHPAPRLDGRGWCEVTRWAGSPDSALFCASESESFSLLVRAPGRSIWVACEDRAAGRYDLPGVLCMMLAHWLARLSERSWPRVPALLAGAEMLMCFRIEVSEQAGPALGIAECDHWLRVIVGPRFVHALCQGDNSADRTLISAVLAACDDRPADAQIALLDEVAPAGRGTFTIWPAPDLRANPPRLLPPPLVVSRDRRAVERAVAGALVPPGQIVVAADEHAQPALLDLFEVLEQMVAQCVAALDPACVLQLMELNERAIVQSASEEVGLPARAALGANVDEYFGSREALGERNVALRTLIERVSAIPPTGDHKLGLRRTGWLRAAAEWQVRLGSAYYALEIGRTRARIVVSPDTGVATQLEGQLPSAGDRMVRQLEQMAPDMMAREHHDWWGAEPQEPPSLVLDAPIDLDEPEFSGLDRAMHEEWHVGLEQLLRLLRALSDLADQQQNAVAVSAVEPLVDALCEMTNIERPTVHAAVSRLTLGPCEDYDVREKAHRPWAPNRERSYLRQPLVQLPDGKLAWSSAHTLTCSRYLFGLIENGRLRGGPVLSKAVMRLSQRPDREFEAALLDRVRELDWQALPRVTSLGRLALARQPGESIGDIDVLAWSAGRKEVWLLDAKRLAPGLEPGSMARENRALQDSVTHHIERLDWVYQHLDRLAAEIGDQAVSEWSIRAALVIDRPLVGAHLSRLALPVWTFWELSRRLGEAA